MNKDWRLLVQYQQQQRTLLRCSLFRFMGQEKFPQAEEVETSSVAGVLLQRGSTRSAWLESRPAASLYLRRSPPQARYRQATPRIRLFLLRPSMIHRFAALHEQSRSLRQRRAFAAENPMLGKPQSSERFRILDRHPDNPSLGNPAMKFPRAVVQQKNVSRDLRLP